MAFEYLTFHQFNPVMEMRKQVNRQVFKEAPDFHIKTLMLNNIAVGITFNLTTNTLRMQIALHD